MQTNLVRVGGGLAATLGGVLGVIASLMIFVFVIPRVLAQPQAVASSSIVTISLVLLILAWVLVSGGLVGLYESQREALGALGVAGFVVALVGSILMVVVLCVQTFHIAVSSGVVTTAAVIAVLVAPLGWLLFSVATYRTDIYPRAAAILLIVGAAIHILIHFSGAEFIVMAAAIAWLGFFLFRERTSSGEHPGYVG
jgi:hypothetical protein